MKNYVRIGALITAPVLLLLFIYLALSHADVPSFITVAAVLVFTVLATRLDDITNVTFGAAGVQAQLEQKLWEAQATIRQLQRIAELFGESSVQQITMSNRWDGLSSKEKREAILRIARELRAIDLPEDRVEKVLATQRKYDLFDYYLWVGDGISSEVTQEQLTGMISIHQVFPNANAEAIPSIFDVEAHLTKHGITSGETIEKLLDWKHYEKTGEHRRLEQWDSRHSKG